MVLLWFTIAPLPSSMLVAFPFYSVFLGFRGTIDFPPLFPWVPEPMSCQPFWWLVFSLFSHSFLLLMPFPQKLLVDFPFWGVPREWLLISLPSRLLHLIFSDSAFRPPFLSSFFPSELIPSLPGWKFSQLLPFVVLLSGFPKEPALCSWIVSPKFFDSLLHQWVTDKDVSVLHSLCFLGISFELS